MPAQPRGRTGTLDTQQQPDPPITQPVGVADFVPKRNTLKISRIMPGRNQRPREFHAYCVFLTH